MRNITTQTITLDVSDGTSMNAYIARPEEPGKFPGIMVLQEAFGVNAHIRDIAERFAREGYVAIAPEMFHRTAPGFEAGYDDFASVRPHLQALTEQGMSADVRASYDWLQKQPQVAPDRIASIGYCMGGRASYLACATVPLQASISYYGGGIAQGLLHRAPDMHAPILFFWGGMDTHITPEHRRAIEEALIAAKKQYIDVNISYADHGFFCDQRGTYNSPAAGLAWKLTLQFLDTYVKEPAGTAHA